MKGQGKIWAMILAIAAVGCYCWPAAAQESFSYADLVRRMIDLEHLAVLPQPGERCEQFSGDYLVGQDERPGGKDADGELSSEGAGFIRRENGQIVLAEMEGPGCIWRIWSARADQGHVKIYLDGRKTPAVDRPFSQYFDGEHEPFHYTSLSYNLPADCEGRSGRNLYFPIPYRKSCKITAEKGWGKYYRITYITFPKGTKVPTFTAKLVKESAKTVQRVDKFLREKLGTDPAGNRKGQETISKTVPVADGQTVRVAELSGPRAVTALKVKMDFKNRQEQTVILRTLVLKITFDGQERPAVRCPLGDFFGTAPGVNYYKSLVTGMTPGGFYAYWYMPFASSAVVELFNEKSLSGVGKETQQVHVEITHAPLPRSFEGMGYFHAKWHRSIFKGLQHRWPDWDVLNTRGRGRFCGMMLHVWNPRDNSWGNGDEKFFVDGERSPSTFAGDTGTEDYFGYASCSPVLFGRPYHAQTMSQGNRGHQSVLRWQIGDNAPFQTSFEAKIGKYKGTGVPTLFASVPCWYLLPEGEHKLGDRVVGANDNDAKDQTFEIDSVILESAE